jgi:hypothetical protein
MTGGGPNPDDLSFAMSIGDVDLAGLDKALDSAVAKLDKLGVASQHGISEQLLGGANKLAAISAAMQPDKIRETVTLTLAAAEAQEAYNKALAAEEWKQGGGFGGAARRMFTGGKEGGAGATNALLGGLLGGQGGGGQLGQIGGAAGAAAGTALGVGPTVGAEIGKSLSEAIPGALATPTKQIAAGLNLLGDSLNALQGPLGPVGAGLDLVTAGFAGIKAMLPGIVGEIAGPLLDALGALPQALNGILQTLTSFAGIASPGQFQMFSRALLDVQGVIGQSFLPVLELMREGIRLFGDVLANILPNSEEVRGALSGLREAFSVFGEKVRGVMDRIGPVVREGLLKTLEWLGGALTFTIGLASQLYDAFAPVGQQLLSITSMLWDMSGASTLLVVAMGAVVATLQSAIPLFHLLAGILAPFAAMAQLLGYGTSQTSSGERRSSIGAAATEPHFQSIAAYQQQLQLAAYREPGSTMASVPRTVTQIAGTLDSILAFLEAWTPKPDSATSKAVSFAAGLSGASVLGMFRGNR